MRQRETLKRFGVTNLLLRPFQDLRVQRAQKHPGNAAAEELEGTINAIPAAAKLLGVAAIDLTAEEANAALQSGDLERAVGVMTGVNLLTDTAHALGDEVARWGAALLDCGAAGGGGGGERGAAEGRWSLGYFLALLVGVMHFVGAEAPDGASATVRWIALVVPGAVLFVAAVVGARWMGATIRGG